MKLDISIVCPNCGKTLEEIHNDRRPGCAFCYTVFSNYIEKNLNLMHGSFIHVGMIPKIRDEREKLKSEYFRLKKDLREAIGKEDYKAAYGIDEDLKLIREKLSAED